MLKVMFLVMCTFFVAACQAAPAKYSMNESVKESIKGSAINKSTFKQAMAYGVVTDLNTIESDADKQLWLKLYRIPLLNGDCFKETHGVCQYRYLLSVSTFDENPEFNVFEIAETGEVVKTEWLASKNIDTARLALTFNAFSKEALNNNDALKAQEKVITINVTSKKLVVEN